MGNEEIKFNTSNHKYRYYTSEQHPIQGIVDVYRQQGENYFVMKKVTMHSDQIITLANKIMKIVNKPKILHYRKPLSANNQSAKQNTGEQQQQQIKTPLIKYFGHQKNNPTVVCNDIIQNNSVTTFWEYFNHDLQKDALRNSLYDSNHNQSSQNSGNAMDLHIKDQKKIWEILRATVTSFAQLWKQPGLGVALQFTKNNIVFSPDRTVKIYWGNIESNNAHRHYFRYFQGYGLAKVCYAAEQLQSIRKNIVNRNLNLQKATIFSLGMLLFSYLSNSRKNNIFSYNQKRFSGMQQQSPNVFFDHSQFYCYESRKLKTQNIQKILNFCYQQYSPILFMTLRSMIELDIFKRINIDQLSNIVSSTQVQSIINRINNEKNSIKAIKDNISTANTSQKMFNHDLSNYPKKNNQKISLRI